MQKKKIFSTFLGILVHGATSSLAALALATLWGSLTPLISALSLVFGLIIGVVAARASDSAADFRWNSWRTGVDGFLEKFFFVVILVFSLRHFYLLFYLEDGLWRTLNYHNLGDLPLHINYIRAMSEGNSFPLANPSFAAELLRYPYGMDLYNALWDSLGVPLQAHFFVVGLGATFLSLVALRAFASWWGLIGFFFSGGWLGWWFFPYSHSLMQDTAWKNMFLTVFVTQRGFLWALPAGLWILQQISSADRLAKTSWWILGLVWGSLAFFHVHSFVALSLMMAYFSLRNGQLVQGLKSFIVAGPLGVLFVLFSTDSFRQASVVRLSSGWTFKNDTAFWSYLNFNFGPYLYLFIFFIIFLIWQSFRQKSFRTLFDFVFYSFLFLIFFYVLLAPYDWDNIKVLIWAYLGILSVIAAALTPRLRPWSKPLLAAVLAASGLVVVTPTLFFDKDAQVLYADEELQAARRATQDLPRDAVFFATEDYAHVLTYLGRLRTAGYEGHLFAHGVNYGQQKELNTEILQREPSTSLELLQEAGANYIFLGPREQSVFAHQWPFWMKELKNVSSQESVPVLEIHPLSP